MPCKFAIVCEAEADFRTAAVVVERLACERIEWINAELLASCSLWVEPAHGRSFLSWSETRRLAEQFHIKAHGHFGDGQPGRPDARAARRALLVLNQLFNTPLDGIILLRDDDGQAERRVGLEQARSDSPHRERICLGLAHRTRECWVLSGFDPRDQGEETRLATLRERLGFDPRLQSNRLNDNGDNEERSPKRALRELTSGDKERESDCLLLTPVDTLRTRCPGNGLAEFIEEVAARLLPSFGSQPSRE